MVSPAWILSHAEFATGTYALGRMTSGPQQGVAFGEMMVA